MVVLGHCSSRSHDWHRWGRVNFLCCSWSGGWSGCLRSWLSIGFGRCAISRDVPCLPAFVANLASRVQRATIWCGAVSGDVAQFSACITLHSLRLAITRVVIWSAALVASGSSVIADKSTSKSTGVTTARSTSTTWSWCRVGGWAAASQMSNLATRIASASCCSATKAECWAVCLDVT